MSGKTYKVLIVDDSPAIHILIERAITPEGFIICSHAKNGKEAVERFKEFSPDVVTMDVTMPVMDGLDASKEILKINHSAKILMLSAMGDDAIIEEAKMAGIKNFLTKPFTSNEILQALKIIAG